MKAEKYGIQEYIKEFEEILNEKPTEPGQQKPNILQAIRAKKEEKPKWPLT